MNKYLIKLANHLDKKGLHKEADYVDWVLRQTGLRKNADEMIDGIKKSKDTVQLQKIKSNNYNIVSNFNKFKSWYMSIIEEHETNYGSEFLEAKDRAYSNEDVSTAPIEVHKYIDEADRKKGLHHTPDDLGDYLYFNNPELNPHMPGFDDAALSVVSKFLYNNPQRGVKNAILLADHLNGNFIIIDFPLELPISLADLNTKLINVSTHIKGEMPDGMKMTFPEAEALMMRHHKEVSH